MLENAYKITSKSKFSIQNVQIPYHLHPALSYSPENRNDEGKQAPRKFEVVRQDSKKAVELLDNRRSRSSMSLRRVWPVARAERQTEYVAEHIKQMIPADEIEQKLEQNGPHSKTNQHRTLSNLAPGKGRPSTKEKA